MGGERAEPRLLLTPTHNVPDSPAKRGLLLPRSKERQDLNRDFPRGALLAPAEEEELWREEGQLSSAFSGGSWAVRHTIT